MNIKRIIAREGLIIMGIIVSGLCLLWISDRFPPYPPAPAPKLIKVTAEEYKSLRKEGLSDVKIVEIDGLRIAGPDSDKRTQKEKMIERLEAYKQQILLEENPRNEIVRKQRIMLEGLAWRILLFGYLLYLPIRFIIWAIGTLRKKES